MTAVGQVDGVAADPRRRAGLAVAAAAGDGPDPGEEFVDAERFGDVVVGAGVEGVDLVAAVRAAGQHDDRDRVQARSLRMTSTPSMSGRPRSSTTRSGWSAAAAVQRLGAVGGGDHVVLAGVQVDPQRAQDLRLVVDDEDAGHRAFRFVPVRRCRSRRSRVRLLDRAGRCRLGGQAQGHGEAAARGVVRGEAAAHGLGQPAGQGQPEADAGGVVSVAEALEGQEDAVPVGRGDARAVVDERVSTRPPWSLTVIIGRLVGRAVAQRRWRATLTRIRSSRAGSAWTSGRSSGMWTAMSRPAGAEVVEGAWRSVSAMLIGCGDMASAPACSRLMSSRFSTRRVSRSRDSSAVASSSSRSASLKTTSVLRRLVDRGLGRGQRGAQVVADRGEQRGAHPVDLGERPGGGGLLGEPLLPQRDGGLGGERLDHPAVGGGERMSAQDEGELVVDGDLDVALGRGEAGLVADGGGDPPGVGVMCRSGPGGRVGAAFQQGDAGEAEGFPELVEQRGQRAGAAQHAAGQGGQGLGLGAGAGGLAGAAGGQVDGGADRDRDGRNTIRARTFSRSAMVNRWIGGVK